MRIENRKNKTNKEKGYSAYKEGVQAVYPNMGEGDCILLSFCFVEMVKGTILDDKYQGFMYSDYHTDENVQNKCD